MSLKDELPPSNLAEGTIKELNSTIICWPINNYVVKPKSEDLPTLVGLYWLGFSLLILLAFVFAFVTIISCATAAATPTSDLEMSVDQPASCTGSNESNLLRIIL
ncbi:hypothetical protein QQP08_022865 [Theobroma cacao]|nr:hypothetical protein QQP08_022865 [Theobroma cacao]